MLYAVVFVLGLVIGALAGALFIGVRYLIPISAEVVELVAVLLENNEIELSEENQKNFVKIRKLLSDWKDADIWLKGMVAG